MVLSNLQMISMSLVERVKHAFSLALYHLWVDLFTVQCSPKCSYVIGACTECVGSASYHAARAAYA